jgi:predicted regulator of Ras-like GTPase activity (Roadblock/LC7/MglB family)
MEAAMTDQPIDPAATPDDPDAPQIAADDAGASALAERAAKQAANDDIEQEDA